MGRKKKDPWPSSIQVVIGDAEFTLAKEITPENREAFDKYIAEHQPAMVQRIKDLRVVQDYFGARMIYTDERVKRSIR